MVAKHHFSLGILLLLGPALQTEHASVGDTETDAVARHGLLQQVPQTMEDIPPRVELARKRLEALGRVAAPPEGARDVTERSRETARQKLLQAWEAYSSALQQFTVVRDGLAKLTGQEHLDSLTTELAEIHQETKRLKGASVPDEPSEERINELRAKIAVIEGQVASLSESQTRLSKQLTTGFQSRKQSLQEEIARLRLQRDELEKLAVEQTTSTLAPTEQERLRFQREELAVRLATVELALQNLAPEQQQAQHAHDQGGRRVAALREQLTAMQTCLSKLTEARTRARVRELEETETEPGAESALRDVQLFRERVLLQYFQAPDSARQRQKRFPQRSEDRIKNKLNLAEAYWNRVVSSLDDRSGDELATLSERVKQEKRDFDSLAANLRTKLSQTLDELQQLQAVRERALQRFAALAENITKKARDTAEHTQLETALVKERAALEEGMRSVVDEVEKLSGRVEATLTLVEQWIAKLNTHQQQIRSARLSRRDSGLWGAPWVQAGSDLSALVRSQRPTEPRAAEVQAVEALHRELFGERMYTSTRRRIVVEALRESLRAVPHRAWMWSAVGIVVAALTGMALHRLARRRGIRLARVIVEQASARRDETHPIASGLSDRINLMLLNMIGDLVLPLIVGGVLVVAVWIMVPEDMPRQLVATFLGTLAVALILMRLVHHVFEAASPPHRPLPCSDDVAWHYRRWLGVLILFSALVLLIPLSFGAVDLAPALQAVFFEIHKTGFLVLLLVFLWRRQRVLGLGYVGEAAWGMMLAWIAYPVFVVAVAALLVLQVIGFGALVNYLGAGLLLTVGILILMGFGIEYLGDVIARAARELPGEEVSASPDVDGATAITDPALGRSRYVLTISRWFIRLAGLVVTILLILWAWDVPMQAADVDWIQAGLGALVVVVALLLDRLLVSTLFTLSVTGRLPPSTVNIIRRWLRGVLAIIVGLALVAIAGFEIRNLWTILATFLAMVAIGFVAVWSILSNLLATLVILIWRPFNVGEQVTILPEGLEGQVIDINFMYTTLKAEEGAKIAIPNNLFAQKFIRRKAIRGQPKRTLAEQLEAEVPLGE